MSRPPPSVPAGKLTYVELDSGSFPSASGAGRERENEREASGRERKTGREKRLGGIDVHAKDEAGRIGEVRSSGGSDPFASCDVEYESRHVARRILGMRRDAMTMRKRDRERERKRRRIGWKGGCRIFFPVETNALRAGKFQSLASTYVRTYVHTYIRTYVRSRLFQLGRTEIHDGEHTPAARESAVGVCSGVTSDRVESCRRE